MIKLSQYFYSSTECESPPVTDRSEPLQTGAMGPDVVGLHVMLEPSGAAEPPPCTRPACWWSSEGESVLKNPSSQTCTHTPQGQSRTGLRNKLQQHDDTAEIWSFAPVKHKDFLSGTNGTAANKGESVACWWPAVDTLPARWTDSVMKESQSAHVWSCSRVQ